MDLHKFGGSYPPISRTILPFPRYNNHMSKVLPRLVHSDRRQVVFEECSHDESLQTVSETVNSIQLIKDRGDGDAVYHAWLDNEENRKYVADSKGELYYCRLAEVRGPGFAAQEPPPQPTFAKVPDTITFVNYDGEEVDFHPGDRIQVCITDEGMPYVSKV